MNNLFEKIRFSTFLESNKVLKNLKYSIREELSYNDNLFWVLKYIPSLSDKVITTQSELVIEGYPRSANSYLYHAIKRNNTCIKISSHLHTPLQIKKAINYNIPHITLIREPKDAILSLLVANPNLNIEYAVNSYINFYESLLTIVEKLNIIEFNDLINKTNEILIFIDSLVDRKLNINIENINLIFDEMQLIHNNSNRLTNLIPKPHKHKLEQKKLLEIKYGTKIDKSSVGYLYNYYSKFKIQFC